MARPGRKPGVKSVSEDERKVGKMITLPRETWAMLDAWADREKITRAELFRQIIETWRDKMSETTITITTADLTEDERERFVAGWETAGGDTSDVNDDNPNPWCMPWYWRDTIEVKGTTPEEWGAAWWEANKDEIEELLAQEAAIEEDEEDE